MKKVFLNIDRKLLIVSILLFVTGLLMVFSSSSIAAYMRYDASPSNFFWRQALFLIIGLLAFLYGITRSTRKYKAYSWILMVVVSIVLILLLLYGKAVNNTIGWIGFRGFGIQPSEFAKLIMIIWLANYYNLSNDKKNNLVFTVLIPMAVGVVIAALIAMQNDYGTALIFGVLVIFMFFISDANKKIKKTVFFAGVVMVSLFGLMFSVLTISGVNIIPSEKLERFNFFNPCSKYQTTGNQVCNGYIAIKNSNFFGKGLGNSTQKYLYLPESHTDFIFAIYVEELGVFGVIWLFSLYIVLFGRIITIGKKAYGSTNAMICYGFAFLVFIHIIVNLFGLLGLCPLTGVPLPFMSYGGSFTLTLILGLTAVQRINYEANIKIKKGEQ